MLSFYYLYKYMHNLSVAKMGQLSLKGTQNCIVKARETILLQIGPLFRTLWKQHNDKSKEKGIYSYSLIAFTISIIKPYQTEVFTLTKKQVSRFFFFEISKVAEKPFQFRI